MRPDTAFTEMTTYAPWTKEQVDVLNANQAKGHIHPFTCGRRSNNQHNWYDGDVGTLLATRSGWVCRDCDYTQDWAYNFMLKPIPSPWEGIE
jgi:hypothetical protein